MSDRDYVAEAAEQGWVDKDAWKGDPEKHTDAKTFVERGEKIAGILKSKNDRLERRIDNLEQSNRQFGEYHKKTIETQRVKNSERVSELKAKLAEAVTNGDGVAFDNTQREIDSLSEEAPTQANDEAAWGRLSSKWVENNPWYNDNPKMQIYADGLAERLVNEGFRGQSYFSELTRRVQEDNPDEFKNPNRSKPTGVETDGQVSTVDSKDQTYDNLPAEDKAACDGFVKQGFMSQEDYVKTYEWEV